MFDPATVNAVQRLAVRMKIDPSALLAVAEVESAGQAFALVGGRREPLIRFEGHYFDRRLSQAKKKAARAQGLASPTAGEIKNPNSQEARWKLLERAAAIDAQAAYESVSWGVGQVMGAHWELLDFRSVDDMVDLCRRDVAGQVEVMVRYIKYAGLEAALNSRDWSAFARGYNGPGYQKDGYDKKLAAAYKRWQGKKLAPAPPAASIADLPEKPEKSDGPLKIDAILHRGSRGDFVIELQTNLQTLGFLKSDIEVDGEFGMVTERAVKAFQTSVGAKADGWAGPRTIEAIGKALHDLETAPKLAAANEIVDAAASDGKGVSKTEIAAGVVALGGAASTADDVSNAVQSARGLYDTMIAVGPWVVLGLIIIGGAWFIWRERRKKRVAAQAVQEVM